MPSGTSTTVGTLTGSGVVVSCHEIGITGLAGAIFFCVLGSLMLFIIGFATPGWEYVKETGGDHTYKVGLWDTCYCGGDVHNKINYTDESWFMATQAMITIGLICLIVAAIAIINYMFFHFVSKTRVITITIASLFIGVLFMVLGFIIFGAKTADYYRDRHLQYSFVLCVIAAIICVVAGCIAVVQLLRARRVTRSFDERNPH